MNRVLLLVFLAVALAAGAWFGEDLSAFFISPSGLATSLFLAGACFAVDRLRSLRYRLSVALACIVLFVVGTFAGRREAQQAYNDCVLRGEPLRLALQEFHQQHGAFPNFLSELPGPLPGRRLLRGTLLHYTSNAAGYTVSFSDYLVTHQATDSEDFLARK